MQNGNKITYTYRSYNGIIDKLHNRLIELIVGDKPVMMNMNLEVTSEIGVNNEYILWVNNTIETVEGDKQTDRYYTV